MKSNLIEKVNKLNELFHKAELGTELTESEKGTQKMLRDEVLDYIRFAITNNKK